MYRQVEGGFEFGAGRDGVGKRRTQVQGGFGFRAGRGRSQLGWRAVGRCATQHAGRPVFCMLEHLNRPAEATCTCVHVASSRCKSPHQHHLPLPAATAYFLHLPRPHPTHQRGRIFMTHPTKALYNSLLQLLIPIPAASLFVTAQGRTFIHSPYQGHLPLPAATAVPPTPAAPPHSPPPPYRVVSS